MQYAIRRSDGRWWICYSDDKIRMEISFYDGEDKDRMYQLASINKVHDMFKKLTKDYKSEEDVFPWLNK